MTDAGSAFLVSVLWIIIAGIVILILDYFGDRKTFPWFVWAITFVSYFVAFTIIIMLPLDLASTKYRICVSKEPKQHCEPPLIEMDSSFLYRFWQVFYWISFNIQMFIAPVMQGYCNSGSFTSWGKLKDGIMDNVYFYASVGAPSIIFVLYAIFGAGVKVSNLLNIAIPLMNSYGLILLVLLMSYGLVEIPRGLWFESSVQWKLRYLEVKAPALKESCVDSESEMYEVASLLALATTKIPESDDLRPKLEKILEKCPLALSERRHVPPEGSNRITFDEKYLVALHAQIKRAEFVNRREQAKLKALYETAFFYQDIINNYRNDEQIFESPFWGVQLPESLLPWKKYILKAAWWYYVWIQPILMKCLGILCLVLSILIIWSESTFQFSSVKLSIPAFILDSQNSSYFTIEILSVAFLCYMCTCTYSTLLKLKLFDFFEMVPNHYTNESSLIFVGAYLCKLTFPLMYNYLNMGNVVNEVDGSYPGSPELIQFLGPSVNMAPLLGEGYNDWIAFLILIVCTIFALNLHNRIASLFGSKSYFLESMKDGNGDAEGRQIIETARIAELRKMNRETNSNVNNTQSRASNAPRARNTADLLAKYKNRATGGNDDDIEGGSTENTSSSRSNRAFGNLGFGAKNGSKNGYQSLN